MTISAESSVDIQVDEKEAIISTLEEIEKKHIYSEQIMLSIVRLLDQLLE